MGTLRWLTNGLAGISNEFRTTFKEEHPDVKGVAAVGKAGGERWKSMSEAVRICSLLLNHMHFNTSDKFGVPNDRSS